MSFLAGQHHDFVCHSRLQHFQFHFKEFNMKKNLIWTIALLLCGMAATAQTALYIEFVGDGIPHRGVIQLDAQGRGWCRIAFGSNGTNVLVDQQVQMQPLQGTPAYAPSFWGGGQQQQQSQGFVMACANPVYPGGQPAAGYNADNFFVMQVNGGVQMINRDASGRSCAVNFRPIQTQQELQSLLQSLEGRCVQQTTTTPSSGTPTGTTQQRPGPKYPPAGGSGKGMGRQ